MKLKYMSCTCVLVLFICLNGLSQSNPRMKNENYMYTVFYDGFDGATLNRDAWTPSQYGKKDSGLNIWVDNANTVNQANGRVNLSQFSSPGYTSIIPWDHDTLTADYISGEITSDSSFLYGSFECSAKYANQRGSWPAFWLYGAEVGIPCPPGGYACEIDISEYWNVTNMNLLGQCYTVNKLENNSHLYYPPIVCGTNNSYPWYNAAMGSSMDDNFHVYKCVWTPDKIDFYMDNVLKNTALKVSDPVRFPDLAMHVKLSQQVPTLPCGYITCPQTSSFDYVKAKQFFLAPEITLSSNIICSSGTATIDVDPLATNITWQLTPSNLFSGVTSGTGKVVNITPSSIQGKGKITYTFNISSDQASPKETYTAEKDIWIKGPDASETSFDVYRSDGVRATQVGGTFLMCPNTTYHIYVMNSGPVPLSNYTWTVPSAWTRNYTSQNIISVYTNSSPGGQVVVNATNTACNTTVPVITGYLGSNYSCGSYYMALTPNPSVSETSIVISADGEKVVNENTEWDLEVYDQQQGLKEKKTKIKGKDGKINTSSWKDGVYIINAIVDGQKISEKLLVKH